MRVRSVLSGSSVWRIRLTLAGAGLVAMSVIAAMSLDRAVADQAPEVKRAPAIATPNASRCDWLDPSVCLQPWPNNFFTRADKKTATKLRINLNKASMAVNTGVTPGSGGDFFTDPNTPINPVDYNRNDGFSPGQAIVVHVKGMDNQAAFDATGIVPITNIADYSRANQPVVVINDSPGFVGQRIVCRARSDRDHQRGSAPDHPAYPELRRGNPLRSGVAEHEERGRCCDPGIQRLPCLSRPHQDQEKGGRGSPEEDGVDHRGGDQGQDLTKESLSGLGLHHRQSPLPQRASPRDAQRRILASR